MPREWTDDMGEISGFGGGYEAVCRAMVLAGIEWIDKHPDADLKFRSYENIFGVVIEASPDADALTEAMMNAPVYLEGQRIQARVRDDCTGAMHHAAVLNVLAYKRLGWDAYVRERRKQTNGAVPRAE